MNIQRFPVFIATTFSAFAMRLLAAHPESLMDYVTGLGFSAIIGFMSLFVYYIVRGFTEPKGNEPPDMRKAVLISLACFAGIGILFGFLSGS